MVERTEREHLEQTLRQEQGLLTTLQQADANHDHQISGDEAAQLMVKGFIEKYQKDAAAYKAHPIPANTPITPDELRQDMVDAHAAGQPQQVGALENLNHVDFAHVPDSFAGLQAQLRAATGNTLAFETALKTTAQEKAAAVDERAADTAARTNSKNEALSTIPEEIRKAHPEIEAKLEAIYSQDTTALATTQIPPEVLKQHPELQTLLALQKASSAEIPALGANDDLHRELIKVGKELAQYKPEHIAEPTLENLSQAVAAMPKTTSERGGR